MTFHKFATYTIYAMILLLILVNFSFILRIYNRYTISSTDDDHFVPHISSIQPIPQKKIVPFPSHLKSYVKLNATERKGVNIRNGRQMTSKYDGFHARLSPGVFDFAIVGFAKCGTTSLMRYLAGNREVFIMDGEHGELCDYPPKLNHFVYSRIRFRNSGRRNVKRGIKCPQLIELGGYLTTMYSETKLIIGLRHPIKWFESYFNFRANNSYGQKPNITESIGEGSGDLNALVTHRARFHVKLAALGTTSLDEEEKKYLPDEDIYLSTYSPPEVFVYDVDQMQANDTSIFRKSLQNFLELENPLPEPPHIIPDLKRKGKLLKLVTKIKIDICDDQYKAVRDVLLDHAIKAQEWIRRYFIESKYVTVPNRVHFEHLLEKWKFDPCDLGDYEGRRSVIDMLVDREREEESKARETDSNWKKDEGKKEDEQLR